MASEKYDITGMTCSACSSHVEKSVSKLPGIQKVHVNLLTNSLSVAYDSTLLESRQIIGAVENAGYGATKHTASTAPVATKNTPAAPSETAQMKNRLVVSFAFLIPLFYLSMGHMLGWPLPHFFHGIENAAIFAFSQFLLTLPIAYVNRKYFIVGFKTLLKGAPNMDALIAIGSSAAIGYGIFAIYQIGYGLGHQNLLLVEQYAMDLYFESAATILTLITVGKYLETKSKGKTSEAITKLINLAPKTATIIRDTTEMEIPVEYVQVGDVVIVKPGQSIPVDGIITAGHSTVDESALTGESIPVGKAPGDQVIAATINKSGAFQFRASKVGNDTTLAQIIQLVEEASSSKAPIAKLADKVSSVFVPVVISIALLAGATWLWLGYPFDFALSITIAVLVISCPCALGLATPVAIMVGTGKGAENGILIKSAEALETAHIIDTIVLDKTGTLTQGKPQVIHLIPSPGIQEETLLATAAALEKPSEHPLAHAITTAAANRRLTLDTASHFQALSGLGLSAMLGASTYLAGNLRLMGEHGIQMDELSVQGAQFSALGETPLYFAKDGQALGLITVADVLKESSPHAVAEFQALGLDVVMLTGDNRRTAEAIGTQAGITTIIAEVLPGDKAAVVQKLQATGQKVAMVGDGINDAPALACADVGIAIGAGTDIAIESADIVLMKNALSDVATAIRLSKAVIRNIKQNLFWAFFYNSIGIPLAAGVFFTMLHWKLSPMYAAAAMSLSSVCVVTNALRLKRFKPTPSSTTTLTTVLPSEASHHTKGEMIMTKTLLIDGMTCPHCSARVEKALNALDGVQATVDLAAKTATITLSHDVADDLLIKAVTDADYTVISLS